MSWEESSRVWRSRGAVGSRPSSRLMLVHVRRLTTTISAHNTRALRFATARGFRQEAFSPRYAVIDGRVADRVRMGKILAP